MANIAFCCVKTHEGKHIIFNDVYLSKSSVDLAIFVSEIPSSFMESDVTSFMKLGRIFR